MKYWLALFLLVAVTARAQEGWTPQQQAMNGFAMEVIGGGLLIGGPLFLNPNESERLDRQPATSIIYTWGLCMFTAGAVEQIRASNATTKPRRLSLSPAGLIYRF